MSIDTDKIDNYTLALLNLVSFEDSPKNYRAWKGFDWDTLNRLYEKGYIFNPKGKTKSISLTELGQCKMKALFEEFFC